MPWVCLHECKQGEVLKEEILEYFVLIRDMMEV